MDKKAVQSRVACLISGMSREQLCDFVSTYARCLSAEQAGRFLRELEWICRDSGGFSAAEPKQSRENLREELEQVQNKLGRIETGELTLDSDYNEECPEAEEWDEVFVFTDPRGLMPLLEQAFELVTRCTMAGLYQEAAALTLRLIALKVSVEGEAEDYDLEPFALEDLTDLELLPEGIHVKLLDGLYALYRLEPSEEHIRQMWEVLALRMNGVTLKDVLRGRGEEPEHRKAFLTMWVERLNAETGRRADELLTEALSTLAEGEELYRQIQRVGDKHPALYLWLLTPGNWTKQAQQLLDAGEAALRVLAERSEERAEAALLSAKAALRLGQIQRAEELWLEAFRAQPKAVNLLRLICQSRDYNVYRGQVEQIVADFLTERAARREGDTNPYRINSELAKELPLSFLTGDFADVMQRGLDCQKWLGWTLTPIKMCINLVLTGLNTEEAPGKALSAIAQDLPSWLDFSGLEYGKGLNQAVEPEDAVLLRRCLQRWRTYYPIPESMRLELTERLDQMLEKRTEAILKNGRRYYYGECACWIAALGEIQEEQGQEGAKEALLGRFRRRYPRHSAFHRELRRFQ